MKEPDNEPELYTGHMTEPDNVPEHYTGHIKETDNVPELYTGHMTEPDNVPELYTGHMKEPDNEPEQIFINLQTECFGQRWTKVFTNDASGGVVSGDRSDLIQAVTSGSDVRVVVDGGYATSLQNVYPLGEHLCGQALFHVSKQGYDKFQDDAYWWFVNICTTGYFNMARYNVGEAKSRGDNVERRSIEWFVRPRCNKTPVYEVNDKGTAVHGSVGIVADAVKNGHGIRITSSSSYTFPADDLAIDDDETEVAAQSVWHVSESIQHNHRVFQSNAYWWFTIWSTTGSRHISRWTIGEHRSRGETRDNSAARWFSDPCWRLAYRHDGTGERLEGSLGDLFTAVSQGHRVKVMYRNNVISVKDINIRRGHISASLIDSVSKKGIGEFQSNVYWYWRIATTTGKIKTTRYRVGSNKHVSGEDQSTETISWFVDKRSWNKVLTVNDKGVVTYGSKAALVQAVKNGAELRSRLDFATTAQDTYSFLEADNIGIDGDNIGAMNIRSVSVQNDGPSEVKFQNNAYWWFTITTTTGRIDMSRWTVGTHQSRGHTNAPVATEWFVAE